MKLRTIACLGVALTAALPVLLAAPAAAQVQPGVGFNPPAVGQLTSRYYVQNPTSGAWIERDVAINFSVTDPLTSGAEFERRWGPGSYTRKRWLGPDNELTATVEDALTWAFQNRPDLLGVSHPAAWSGHPTQVEVLDACATGYGISVVVAFGQATWPGASPDRRQTLIDPNKPKGDFEERNFYWPLTMYYHNRFVRFLPISPQVMVLEGQN